MEKIPAPLSSLQPLILGEAGETSQAEKDRSGLTGDLGQRVVAHVLTGSFPLSVWKWGVLTPGALSTALLARPAPEMEEVRLLHSVLVTE